MDVGDTSSRADADTFSDVPAEPDAALDTAPGADGDVELCTQHTLFQDRCLCDPYTDPPGCCYGPFIIECVLPFEYFRAINDTCHDVPECDDAFFEEVYQRPVVR